MLAKVTWLMGRWSYNGHTTPHHPVNRTPMVELDKEACVMGKTEKGSGGQTTKRIPSWRTWSELGDQ